MLINCIHGYYMMTEEAVGQASDFSKLYGLDLVKKGDYFTFDFLKDAPDHSLIDREFLGFKATTTHEGKPYEVFEANQVFYDFNQGKMRSLKEITEVVDIRLAGNRLMSKGLVLAGSKDQDGRRITGFSAWFYRDRATWLYSEVTYG